VLALTWQVRRQDDQCGKISDSVLDGVRRCGCIICGFRWWLRVSSRIRAGRCCPRRGNAMLSTPVERMILLVLYQGDVLVSWMLTNAVYQVSGRLAGSQDRGSVSDLLRVSRMT
jgi:hypothetical protein